ncbi:MAG: hypothetical protein GY827_12440 [Cytophagales bacterium]|nr:hypothetical protein [Cytophagales bacterium]
MKKISIIILGIICPFFLLSSCDQDCETVELADLSFESPVSISLVGGALSGIYEVTSTVVNQDTDDCFDGSNIQIANSTLLEETIMYSPNPDLSGAITYSGPAYYSIPSLSGGQSYTVSNQYGLGKSGYYIIEHKIDHGNYVFERDEQNNASKINHPHNLGASRVVIQVP